MGRGCDRYGLARRVDASGGAHGVDGREAAPEGVRPEVGGVQQDVVASRLRHAAGDGGGHHVARGEVGERVHADHHPLSPGVHQDAALAPHGLGDQGPATACTGTGEQHGGVELDEFEVRQARSRAQRQGESVAGGALGVGRRLVELSEAAGGQQYGRGGDQAGHGGRVQHREARHRSVRRAQHVQGGVSGQHGDAAVAGCRQQGPLDLGAGGVAPGVHDAEGAVAALAGAGQGAVGAGVEPGAGAAQPLDGVRAVRDDLFDRVLFAESGSGCVGVLRVPPDGVPGLVRGGQHDGHAALGVAGVAVTGVALGHHQDPQPEFDGGEGGGEAGDAGPHHHEVRASLPARVGHSPPPGRPMAIIRWTDSRPRAAISGSTCTSSAPSRSARSSAAGVIIFM